MREALLHLRKDPVLSAIIITRQGKFAMEYGRSRSLKRSFGSIVYQSN